MIEARIFYLECSIADSQMLMESLKRLIDCGAKVGIHIERHQQTDRITLKDPERSTALALLLPVYGAKEVAL
jgi:hypothetical protein